MTNKKISVVAPFYNEELNVQKLHGELVETCKALTNPYELIYINDGSRDGTLARIEEIAASDPHVVVVPLVRNFGQTAAMQAGFDAASGDIIVAIDGDGQNDPADIPALLEKLGEGYDVVSGWRKDRKDKAISRRLPSMVANWLISRLSGVHLNDYGCSLKAYRKDSIKDVRLYGDMHRFIPIYSSWQGGRITQIAVNHRPRTAGVSKYGINRVFKVILDLLLIMFFDRYLTKPIHVFGAVSLISFCCAFGVGLIALFLKFFRNTSFIATPLPLLVVLLLITTVITLFMGILAELIVRTYFESQQKRTYIVDPHSASTER